MVSDGKNALPVALMLLCILLVTPEARTQSIDALALETGYMGANPTQRSAPPNETLEVKVVPQPAFAWAIGPWRDEESIRLETVSYRDGGYYVRVVPDDSLSAFRLALGHYGSEEDARRDVVGVPMTVRASAQVIRVERHVVFTPSVSPGRQDGRDVSLTTSDDNQDLGVDRRSGSSRDQGASARQDRRPDGIQPRWTLPGTMLRPFEVRFATSVSYDSNIDHDQEDEIASVGFVPALMLRYRSTLRNPVLMASYGISRHQYTETDKWDRVSQMFSINIRPPMRGTFRMETDFDVASNGSFEDRDVSDQIQVVQAFEYRFTRDVRFHTYGTLRWKYPDQNDDDAFKPNVGVILEQKLDGDRTWEMGARYEVNLEEIERGNYSRWTFEMEYEVPISGQTEIEFGIKHRRKNYWNRDVEIEDEDYPRRDQRWILGGAFVYRVSSNVVANLSYGFEARTSNDPEKPFNAHLLDVGFFVTI